MPQGTVTSETASTWSSSTGDAERVHTLERQVAALSAQLVLFEKTVDTVVRPTNWVGIGTLVGGGFIATLSFMGLLLNPISTKVNELLAQHYAILDRFNAHISDGHPAAVIQLINANRDADIERMRTMEDRRKEAWSANEKELDRIRERLDRTEDVMHSNAGVRVKP